MYVLFVVFVDRGVFKANIPWWRMGKRLVINILKE